MQRDHASAFVVEPVKFGGSLSYYVRTCRRSHLGDEGPHPHPWEGALETRYSPHELWHAKKQQPHFVALGQTIWIYLGESQKFGETRLDHAPSGRDVPALETRFYLTCITTPNFVALCQTVSA